jgi:hypothetical protein
VSGVFLVTAIPQLCAGLAIAAMWRLHAASPPAARLAETQTVRG